MSVRISNLTEGTLTSSDYLAFDGTNGTKKMPGSLITNKADKTQLSNRNLLDNGWFTVNQRGITTVSTVNAYFVDRWQYSYGSQTTSTITVTSNGLTTSGDAWALQGLETALANELDGKSVTVSIKYSDGTIESGTVTFGAGVTLLNNSKLIIIAPSLTSIHFRTRTALNIRAVKLELGSVSTLAMDTAPDYGTEIVKCMASTADSNDTYANKCGMGGLRFVTVSTWT